MKINQIRDIVAIAEFGSLGAAARHLHLAQPALSRSVRELERQFGTPFFERHARGMVPTPIGAIFIERARSILRDIQRTGDEISQMLGETHGEVVIGLSFVAHIQLLPKALEPFRKRYPNVRLQIIDANYPSLEGRLKEGSVDFYVGPTPGMKTPPELHLEKLYDNTLIILGRKNHPLSKARSISDLADAEWTTTETAFPLGREIENLFTQHKLPKPRLALRSQSIFTLMVLVSNTDLIALMPVQFAKFPVTEAWMCVIPVKETMPAPPMVMIRRASRPLTPAAQYLLDLLMRQIPRKS